MSWLTKIVSRSVGSTTEQVGNIVDKYHLSKEEKQKLKLEIEAKLQRCDSEIEGAIRTGLQEKERILVAELTQGDYYTRRARPTVVYAGLGFILFNYCLVPVIAKILGAPVEPLELPSSYV